MKANDTKKITKVAKPVIHRQFEGEVKSVGNKTVYAEVKSSKMNIKYQKRYFSTKKYAVHDEKGIAKVGNLITFQECRPLSKNKRWRLVKILK